MTNGSRIYGEISDFVEEQESEYHGIEQDVKQTRHKLRGLEEDHEKTLLTLAEHYLPALSTQHLHDAINNVEDHVKEIVADKKRRINHLEKQTTEAERYIPNLEARVSDVKMQLEIAHETKDQLHTRVEETLANNPQYQTLLDERKTTNKRVTTLDSELNRAINERDKKIGAFEENNAFMYLLDRGFGSQDYDAGLVTRLADNLLAKSINFFENQENYQTLTKNPQLLQNRYESAASKQSELEGQLAEIEQDTERATGFIAQAMEVDGIASRYRELAEELHNEKQVYESQKRELNKLGNATGTFHQRALEYITSYLETIQPDKLLATAKKTPDPKDDILAKNVVDLRTSINTTRKQLSHQVERMQDKQRKLDELKSFRAEFDRKNYNGSRSEFRSGFDINTLLLGYVAGRSSLSSVRSSVDSSQSFRSRSYSSSSSSSSSGFSSGGGFGGGGGFSTGGGF